MVKGDTAIVFLWDSVKGNLQDLKQYQKLSKEDIEKAIEILQGCLQKY